MALSNPDWSLVIEAIRFAAQKHRGQRRTDAFSSPFVNHLIDSVDLAARVGRVTDTPLLVAVALHDVLANTTTTAAEIERRFGAEVRRLVEEVSDPPGLQEAERRKRRLHWARTATGRARVIRLASMTATLSCLPVHRTAAEREEYLKWMSAMEAALGGTNSPLAALFGERMRQEFMRRFVPPVPVRVRSSPRGGNQTVEERMAALLMNLAARCEKAAEGILTGLPLPAPSGSRKPPPPRGPRETHSGPRFPEEPWKRRAEPGLDSIRFTVRDRRVTLVAINGAPPVELSPGLALLLRILASGVRQADGFPAFKSHKDIAAAMTRATGRHASVRAVIAGISRLRTWLFESGAPSPLLLETLPGQLARLRVRGEPEIVEAP